MDGAAVIDSDLRTVQREIDSANAILIQMQGAASSLQGGYTTDDAEEKPARPPRWFLGVFFRIAQAIADRDMSDLCVQFFMKKRKLLSLPLSLTVVWRHREAQVMMLWLVRDSRRQPSK